MGTDDIGIIVMEKTTNCKLTVRENLLHLIKTIHISSDKPEDIDSTKKVLDEILAKANIENFMAHKRKTRNLEFVEQGETLMSEEEVQDLELDEVREMKTNVNVSNTGCI